MLNYFEYFLILAATYISTSAFASLVFNPEGITSSTIELKVQAIAEEFKYKSGITDKKHVEKLLLIFYHYENLF